MRFDASGSRVVALVGASASRGWIGGSRICLGAFGLIVATALSLPQAQAANIITFGDNATACGGSVLCSTDGTNGYNGSQAFDLSTINQWFQIGTAAQPMTAGQFLVVNDTGNILTSFSLTLTDNFNGSTPSVHACTGLQTGHLCDNFQVSRGAKYGSSLVELSGPNFNSCTSGTGLGHTCSSTSASAAADFAPKQITYSWTFKTAIQPGDTFDITFASWNNGVYVTPVPEPGSMAMLIAGLAGWGAMRRRKPKPA